MEGRSPHIILSNLKIYIDRVFLCAVPGVHII